jgi:enoyl-CoA hydratase/carnithine racemase
MHQPPLLRYGLTGDVFDAYTTRDAGLVTMVVAPQELGAAVARLEDSLRLAEPKALRSTKEAFRRVPAMTLADGFAWTKELSLALFRSSEAAEGIRAFREKRLAVWTRRSQSDA